MPSTQTSAAAPSELLPVRQARPNRPVRPVRTHHARSGSQHQHQHQHTHGHRMRLPPRPKRRGVDFEAYGTPELTPNGAGNATAMLQSKPASRGASIWMMLVLGLPRMTIQMAWSAQWAALGPYLNTMLPKFAVQLAQLIGPVVGILLGPTAGHLSDRSTSPYGRRKPFLVYGAIGTLICWMLMGFTRQMGEGLGDHGTGNDGESTDRNWTAVLMIIFYTWMDITVNIMQTPAFLLIADFSGDRQVMGAAIGQGWASVGSILISGYIEIFGPAHNSLGWFLGMLAIIMVVSIAMVCTMVKEDPLELDQSDLNPRMGEHVGNAFYAIIQGIMSLPSSLLVFCIVCFCVMFGYSSYNGNKGQFWGIEVYGGSATAADSCHGLCSDAQTAYNNGVQMAGGAPDFFFNALGYIYSWSLPFLVKKYGVKKVMGISLLPQSFLMIMAFTKSKSFDVFVVAITGISQTCMWALLVPVVVHVLGDKGAIGMYVGALNSANCLGQLLNFILSAALVENSLGYKTPLFVGGIVSFLGFLIVAFLLKLKMYSM